MIFPGFFGYSEDGDVVTFSRGGSDVTGGILAAAVNADVYENFTDVDFVYAANPKLIENPFPIPLFTYVLTPTVQTLTSVFNITDPPPDSTSA